MQELAKCISQSFLAASWTNQQSELSRTLTTRDACNVIPMYDPHDKQQTIETWLEKIESLQHLYYWDDLTTSTFMTSRLKGLTCRWYDTLPSDTYSWNEWKAKIKVAFKSQVDMPDRIAAMLETRKLQDEDMKEYFYNKTALVMACGFEGRTVLPVASITKQLKLPSGQSIPIVSIGFALI